MDLLRFFTAGNVDDGKSTLIGRLLYDSNSISTDVLETLTQQSKTIGANATIDLALLTDGLRAEREQGITIDVAYKFFNTKKRKYIIADTPGHAQYTRNMFTGASTAELAIILVDARNGITEQTKRHSVICSVLGIPKVLVCINKMDLVNYSEEVYETIRQEYLSFSENLNLCSVDFVPVSALAGDNVVHRSDAMNWFSGPTLFSYLEEVKIDEAESQEDVRFRVQYIIRPQSQDLPDYRGYAGTVLSGKLEVGQEIRVLPSGLKSKISGLEFNLQAVDVLLQGQPGVVHLQDDLDLSRGATLVAASDNTPVEKQVQGTICWMDQQAFQVGQRFLLQQQSFRTKAMIQEVQSKIDIHSLEKLEFTGDLKLNELVEVRLKLADPILVDTFSAHPKTGSFILINEATNQTVAGGVITT